MNDVNTIFYFYPGTKDEYEADWNANKINPRTIVFIASTGEIYKGGIRYGGMTQSEVRTQTTTIVNENQFDPSSILNSISTLQGLINGLNTRISGIMTEKQEELTGIIGDVLSEYVTLKKTYRGLFQEKGFTDALDAYLLSIGNVTSDSAIWSTYDQRINSITLSISEVNEWKQHLTDARIQGWIRDGIAGIDLSTFLTSADIEGLIKLDDLKASGVLDSLLTNFSTAFINLKTKAEGSEAIIGAWDRSTMGGTIKDLFSALSIQVNNIESSVTTSLSSTVNSYLQDSALPNYISGYLSTRAGLVLEANLDHSVAALFSQQQYTEAKNAANSYLNTAGFLTETNADGALASIIATRTVSPENQKLYYCDSIDTSETAATFNAASGQSIAVGSYYSATELATICSSTTVIITGTATPFLILGTDSKKYKITKVSAMEGALASSSLYAAIQVGVKNDSSFIDMVADEVNIESKLLNITGETWANILHVNELVVNSLKDADGNSIQVSYLVDKMQENSTYTAEVLDLISGDSFSTLGINYTCATDFAMGVPNKPTVIVSGRPANIKIQCKAQYSLIGNIRVMMGTKDITHKYTRYYSNMDGGHVNAVDINIPCVTDNVVVKVLGCTNVGNIDFGLPSVVNIHGESSSITLTGNIKTNNVYYGQNGGSSFYILDKPVSSWALESAYTGVSIANGDSTNNGSLAASYDAPVITIDPSTASAGTFTIKATLGSGSYATFPITIVDSSTQIADSLTDGHDLYYVDFNVGYGNDATTPCPEVGDYTGCQTFYAVTDSAFTSGTTHSPKLLAKSYSSIETVSYSIDTTLYSGNAASIESGVYLFVNKAACIPVKMTVTLSAINNGLDQIFTKTKWICVKDPIFGRYNSTEDYYLDIFGESDRDLQFVSASQQAAGKPMLTKYISWDRYTTNSVSMIYICDGDYQNGNIPTLTLDTSAANDTVVTPSLYVYTDANSVKRTYLTFAGSNNLTAYSTYNALDHAITPDDQLAPISGQLKVTSADGSELIVFINQSNNFGFYGTLKDQVHNCVSAYYLAPRYYWDTLEWYAESGDTVVRTDLYPDAIVVPASGKWMCKALRGATSITSVIGSDTTLNNRKLYYKTQQ